MNEELKAVDEIIFNENSHTIMVIITEQNGNNQAAVANIHRDRVEIAFPRLLTISSAYELDDIIEFFNDVRSWLKPREYMKELW